MLRRLLFAVRSASAAAATIVAATATAAVSATDSLYTIAGGSAEPEVWADALSDYCSVSSPHLLSWRHFMNDWPAPAVSSIVGLP